MVCFAVVQSHIEGSAATAFPLYRGQDSSMFDTGTIGYCAVRCLCGEKQRYQLLDRHGVILSRHSGGWRSRQSSVRPMLQAVRQSLLFLPCYLTIPHFRV